MPAVVEDRMIEWSASTCVSCGGAVHYTYFRSNLTSSHIRTDGLGELYAYLPLTDDNAAILANVPPKTIENPDYGFSVGRGSWTFTAGAWTTISERVKLNDPKSSNGNHLY